MVLDLRRGGLHDSPGLAVHPPPSARPGDPRSRGRARSPAVAEHPARSEEDDGWSAASRYAAALRSFVAIPVIHELPVALAPRECAVLRGIATYERFYPVGSSAVWGDRQGTAVIGTTDRLLVSHRFRSWLSFWFADLDAVEPALDARPARVELTWTHGEPPLRLSGPVAPLLAVHVAAHTDADGWSDLPGLQDLLKPAPRPR